MNATLKYICILLPFLLLVSCHKKSAIEKLFNCETATYTNLEQVDDVKNLFSVDLPNHWKINLYTDEAQSSIFAADTTKQLTATVLLDVTFIENKIDLNDAFVLQQEQENLSKNLIKIASQTITFQEKPSLFMQYKGKKEKFDYQVCHLFIKLNASNFILAKTEVYGDSLVQQRFCKAFSLIETIALQP